MKNLLNKKIVITGLSLLLSMPFSIAASELHQYAMYHSGSIAKEDCALVQRYSAAKNDTTVFLGQLTGDGCLVTIPHQLYEDRFQFCYLSGFNLYRISDPEMIECVVQKKEDNYIFLASLGKSAREEQQVMCYFTCIGGEGK